MPPDGGVPRGVCDEATGFSLGTPAYRWLFPQSELRSPMPPGRRRAQGVCDEATGFSLGTPASRWLFPQSELRSQDAGGTPACPRGDRGVPGVCAVAAGHTVVSLNYYMIKYITGFSSNKRLGAFYSAFQSLELRFAKRILLKTPIGKKGGGRCLYLNESLHRLSEYRR